VNTLGYFSTKYGIINNVLGKKSDVMGRWIEELEGSGLARRTMNEGINDGSKELLVDEIIPNLSRRNIFLL
jgi:hypothetical protein